MFPKMKHCCSNATRAETAPCSRSKVLKFPSSSSTDKSHKLKDNTKHSAEKTTVNSNHCLLKEPLSRKQHNVHSDFAYEPRTYDVQTAINTPKQRSKSTVSDRQPWSQLLNKYAEPDNDTVFGKLDPLRTLHFLAQELMNHVQVHMPSQKNLQDIVKAMNTALKRVPPEVASTVQLQQQKLDILYALKSSHASKETVTAEKAPNNGVEEIQKLIEGSTMKLEATCKHLDDMCGQLKNENQLSLEAMLQTERNNSKILQNRIQDLEYLNRELSNSVQAKTEEILEFKSKVDVLEEKLNDRKTPNTDVQELKKSKTQLEEEMLKLQHKLRLAAIEKEKYLAILAVRDRQIYEIRNEMSELQRSVNEQLTELHGCVAAVMTTNIHEPTKEVEELPWDNLEKSDHSFKDLDSENDTRQ